MDNYVKKEHDEAAVHSTRQPGNDGTEIDLVELVYHMLANLKLLICLALIGAIGAGLYTVFLVTPLYEATSTIYVLSRSDSAINISDLQIGTELTADYIKVFDMWEVHEEVISNLDLDYSYGQMRNMLAVTNDANTRMLDITITSPDPEEASMIANEYANVARRYISDTMSTDEPNIMSVALTPTSPVSPNKTRNVILGFLLGGILAAGIVTVRFITDDKIKTAEDIRRYTGLSNLAVVPLDSEVSQKGEGKKQRAGRKVKR